MAVAGKGGVGKTTIAGSLARLWARSGLRVLAVDADPSAHLHSVLEIPEGDSPRPISLELELIEERTGARPGSSSGSFFKLNPRVDDIPAKYSREGADGVRLLVLGTIKAAGSGCFCPENALLRNLLDHIMLDENEAVVVDMEAGLEQFGRATCRSVDALLVVVEPGIRSVDTATRIVKLADEMCVRRVIIVGNRVGGEEERRELAKVLGDRGLQLAHALPYDPSLGRADLLGSSPFAAPGTEVWMASMRQLSQDILKKSSKGAG